MFAQKFVKLILLCGLLWGTSRGFSHEDDKLSFNIIRQKPPVEHLLNYGHVLGDKLRRNRDNDSIALKRFIDDEFYGEIIIGHPGQKLYVSFDTAWDLSWVISSKCSSIKAAGCWFHNKYDHSKSSEYKKDGRPFSMNLGNFNMTGFYSYDNISIAHSNVTAQSFVEMVNLPNEFLLNKADGVLGLGLKTGDYDPFFYTLLNQKKIRNPIFSIYLNRDTQSNRGGNVMLGFIDQKHIHKTVINKTVVPDTVTYLKADNNVNYWQFPMDKVFVNAKDVPVLCETGCKAIVDTSSNTIHGPKADVDVIHDAIHASEFLFNRYTVNCDTVNKLPKIDFMIAGKNFTLAGPDYTVKMSYHSITVCVSAFQPANTVQEQDRWILGAAFLSQYYSVYNVYDKTIGFVKASSKK